MIRVVYFSLLFVVGLMGCARDNAPVTNIFIVRHADRPESIDQLNEAGEVRAQELARVLKNIDIDVLYSTNYERTKATVAPVKDAQNLELNLYDPKNLYGLVEEIKRSYLGKNILISGHSNTVLQTIAILGSQADETNIPGHVFDGLYVVQLQGRDLINKFQLEYGADN